MRLQLFIFFLILIQACTVPPPESPENICDIFTEKRNWYKAARRTEKRWGIPVNVTMAFLYQESSFRQKVKAQRRKLLWIIPWKRKSSAKGYAQVLDGTWKEYVSSAGGFFSQRTDFNDAIDFVGWYNYQSHKNLGISKSNAKALYLAYHEGWGGYKKGTYKKKRKLLNIADKVERRSAMYKRQYKTCKRKLRRWFIFF
ncbi:MAG: transglycosylase [Candidatus Marinimicrobia bacterium]|nr:transglycosylase [Candidatus Neomarinimicrobiota bacterium]